MEIQYIFHTIENPYYNYPRFDMTKNGSLGYIVIFLHIKNYNSNSSSYK